MYPLRVLGRVVLGVGLLMTGIGAVLAAGAAIIAGDWWLAREPWIGIGLTSLVVGLATTAVAGLLLNVIEPIGMVRLLSIPPALVTAFLWAAIYLVPLSGACCQQPERDIRTLLYSQPEALAVLAAATFAILLPLAIASRRQLARRQRPG